MYTFEELKEKNTEMRKRLCKYYYDKGATMKDLSDAIGLSPFTISNFLYNRRGLRPKSLYKIMETLEKNGY